MHLLTVNVKLFRQTSTSVCGASCHFLDILFIVYDLMNVVIITDALYKIENNKGSLPNKNNYEIIGSVELTRPYWTNRWAALNQ